MRRTLPASGCDPDMCAGEPRVPAIWSSSLGNDQILVSGRACQV